MVRGIWLLGSRCVSHVGFMMYVRLCGGFSGFAWIVNVKPVWLYKNSGIFVGMYKPRGSLGIRPLDISYVRFWAFVGLIFISIGFQNARGLEVAV